MKQSLVKILTALTVLMIVFFIAPYSSAQVEQKKKDIKILEGELESMRELTFKKDVPVVYMTKQQIKDYIRKELNTPQQKKRLELEDVMLKAFGYVKADFNVGKFYVDMYTEQAMGIYDFREKRFIISTGTGLSADQQKMAASMNMDMEKSVIIHELDHALQDQYFDLGAKIKGLLKTSTDEALAGQSVFEGEATYIMFDYMLRACGFNIDMLPDNFLDMMTEAYESPGFSNDKTMKDAPPYFRKTSIFPYLHGLAFIRYVKSRKGWEGVNELYSSLPVSTAQVINPSLYDRKVKPLKVPFPDRLVRERKMIIDDSLGEFLVKVLLSQYLGKDNVKSTEGWTGDRYLVFEDQGKYLLVWRTEWDSDSTAAFMASSFEKMYSARYPGIAWEKRPYGSESVSAKGSPSLLVARKGNSVLMMQGFTGKDMESVSRSILSLSASSR
jgi:hypothetical protein